MFNSPESNPKGAQLIFTTHSSVALDSNDLRRDQIWFTRKENKKLQTILYPLLKARIDGKLVRKDEKRVKAYLQGEYSAVPEVDPQFLLV
jgi:AAA15 family ATPase/GTPase